MNRIVWIISFFIFSGYYIGLNLLFYFKISHLSRYYTVPLRLIISILSIYLIIRHIDRLKKNNIIFLTFCLLYLLKVILTAAWNESGIALARSWYEYIYYFITFSIIPFFCFTVIDLNKYKDTIINAFLLGGFLLSVSCIFTFSEVLISGGIGRVNEITYETGEEVISPLALGYSGVLTLTLAFYKVIFEKTSILVKFYVFVIIIFSVLLILLGATRGSLVALIFTIPVFLYFSNKSNRIKYIVILIVCLPIFIYAANILGSSLFERSINTIETGDSSGREVLWAQAYEEFLNNPIWGGRIEVSGIYPHNIFLELLMATGIVGFIIFLIFTIYSLTIAIRFAEKNSTYIFILILFINGITQYVFSGSIYFAILLFVPLGLLNNSPNKIN